MKKKYKQIVLLPCPSMDDIFSDEQSQCKRFIASEVKAWKRKHGITDDLGVMTSFTRTESGHVQMMIYKSEVEYG